MAGNVGAGSAAAGASTERPRILSSQLRGSAAAAGGGVVAASGAGAAGSVLTGFFLKKLNMREKSDGKRDGDTRRGLSNRTPARSGLDAIIMGLGALAQSVRATES